jgi:hypothetical protein
LERATARRARWRESQVARWAAPAIWYYRNFRHRCLFEAYRKRGLVAPRAIQTGEASMAKTPQPNRRQDQKSSDAAAKAKPPRDTDDKPRSDADGDENLPDTHTREEVEKIRPNLKR